MRLVKKTVNQDDTSMYHLFYADEVGNPGTDLTFFEIKGAGHTYLGNHSISFTSLRVPNDSALTYWLERFEQNHVEHDGIIQQMNRKVLPFRDPEGQRLLLVSDEKNQGIKPGIPWDKSPVPQEKAITGLGPVRFTVPKLAPTKRILTEVLGFRHTGAYHAVDGAEAEVQAFEVGKGGTGGEVHVEVRENAPKERPGRGSVHHVAFRVKDREELKAWRDHIRKERLPNSGLVDRFYFESLYFREPNGILIELATDGPGFSTDEEVERLGEVIALPPFLEDQRNEIEANLDPIDTTNESL